MDSGNVNARSALMALIGNNSGGSQKAAGENGVVDNNAFAALIASLLSNGKMQHVKGEAPDSSAVKGGNGAADTQADKAKMLNALIAEPAASAKASKVAKGTAEALQTATLKQGMPGPAAGAISPGQFDAASMNGLRSPGQQKASLPTQETLSAAGATQEHALASTKVEGAVSNAQSVHKGQAQQAAAANGGGKGQLGDAPIELMQKAASAGAGAMDQKTVQAVENRAPNAAPLAEAPVKLADQASPSPSRPGAQIIAQQVAQNLTFIGNQGVDRLRFQLHPAELGQVSVQMRIREGVTRIVIAAEHPAAVDAMRQNIGALQQALQNAGLQVERDGLQFNLQNQNDPQHQSGADVERRGDENRESAADQADGDEGKSAPELRADENALFL